MDELQIVAGSRLHFGLICAAPERKWHYGGIGLMIEDPAWKIRVSTAEADSVQASSRVAERVAAVIKTVRVSVSVPPVKVVVQNEVPPHSGLGSGTQLALATGVALELFSGVQRAANCGDLATRLGRNRRSGIGAYGFDKGGFIVDSGRSTGASALSSIGFPEDWRLVLISPSMEQGLSGSTEESFFGEQPYLSDEVVQQLERLVEREILFAIMEGDFDRFAAGIAEYGKIAGDYYAAAQGGTFSNPLIREVVAVLEENGIHGAAQSSWGPSVCVPARSVGSAAEIRDFVAAMPVGAKLTVTVTKARNYGATIRSVAPEDQRSFG